MPTTQIGLLKLTAQGQWGRIAFGTLLTLLTALLALPLAYIVKEAFDKWIPGSQIDMLLKGGLVIVLLRITASSISILTRVLNVKSTEAMTVSLRRILSRRLFRVSQRELDQTEAGGIHDLIVTESNRFHVMANYAVSKVFPSLASCFVLALVLAYLSLSLLLIMVVIWPLMWLINEAVRRYLVKKARISNKANRLFSKSVLEKVRTHKTIRLENKTEEELAHLESRIQATSDAAKPVSIMDTTYLETQGTVLTIISVAVLMAGGKQVSATGMTVGDFISFYVVVNMLNASLRELANGAYHIFLGQESLVKIAEWLRDEDTSVYRGEQEVTLTKTLELKDVFFAYKSALPVLRDFHLTINRGETVVLVGPNGCGKSTVLWLLLGLYLPDSGKLFADGHDYSELDLNLLRTQIGVVTQEACLLDASVGENVAYGCQSSDEEAIIEALELAGAKEWLESLPEGLDTYVGRDGTLLSGGQRQRMSLARALMKRPPFLFFDEPTNHLDAESVGAFVRTIQELKPKPGILIITHDDALRQVADRVFEFREGALKSVSSEL